MTLHESRPQEDTTSGVSFNEAPESLASTLSRLNHISSLFNSKIAKVNFEAMSPFPPLSLAKASTIQYQLWRETGDIKCLTAAESLKTMVRHFSKRWMGAGESSVVINQTERRADVSKPKSTGVWKKSGKQGQVSTLNLTRPFQPNHAIIVLVHVLA
jgi:hypothetical protein